MAEGLNVSRVVDVDVSFSPQAAPTNRFDTLLILGDSAVITVAEKMRTYNSMEGVGDDFATTDPEFLAAEFYFAQTPQPSTLYIARWARTATRGTLLGGVLTTEQKTMSNWTSITSGGFTIILDGGSATDLIDLDFSGTTNLNGVAAIIDAALAGGSVTWDAVRSRFIIQSDATGTTSTVGYATSPGSGANISALLKLTSVTASSTNPGIDAETPVDTVVRLDGLGWYALAFAAATMPTESQVIAVSAYIEATSEKHLFGTTTDDVGVLDAGDTNDIASQLSLGDYTRTMVQYSSSSPYAIASIFGRAFTVNFSGTATMITLKFKTEPLVIPELLTATQADTLAAKRCNVYVRYNNDTSIYQEGVMSGPAYFDEIHGLDWLANSVQTDLWNLLYQSPKIPQTLNGMNMLEARVTNALSRGVENGLIAPGTWNAPGFGNIYDGKYLPSGFYVYSAPIDEQSQTDREQRVSPLIQAAIKLAGAVHTSSVLLSVNR